MDVAIARKIRVLIVDDHAMVREGLRSMLSTDDLDVVGEACDGREGIELTRRLRPGIVLMDVRLPDISGLTALAVIKAEMPSTAVIMVTTYENPEYLAKAIMDGAAGYMLKSASRDELLKSIRTVADGGSLIDRNLLQEVGRQLERGRPLAQVPAGTGVEDDRARLESLTEREVGVLRLIVEGLSNREIADVLCISPGTVKTHVEHIIDKLHVSDRTQAAVWAMRHGLAR